MSVRLKTGDDERLKRTYEDQNPVGQQERSTHLSNDVGYRCWGNTRHSVDAGIPRACSFRFLANRARGRENVFVCLS
jgi:hypothetical protein